MSRKMKPVHLFVPINRVDEAERTVEGFAFVNEVVPGEGGIRLLRSTMEAATPDYMKWGALREMHQPLAAGTASSVEWRDGGAFLRAKVVDDAAWEKVKAGVYKGFSVGVIPQVMRGKDVTTATWAETSLVDRPKDPDSVITMFRAEGLEEQDLEAEVDVAELEPEADPVTDPANPATDPPTDPADPVERGYTVTPDSFSALIAARETTERQQAAWSTLRSVLYSVAAADPATVTNREELARAAIGEFADYYVPLLVTASRDELELYAAMPDLTRLATLESENQTLLTRAETAETSLAAAQERVQTLERTPAPPRSGTPPVRYPQALERSFLANEGEATGDVVEMQSELKRLEDQSEEPDPQKRQRQVQRMLFLQQQLAAAGHPAA